MKSESVRIKGYKVTLMQADSGSWYTQSGAGHTGPHETRDQAVRAAGSEVVKDNARQDQQSRDQQAAAKAHEAKTVECRTCHVRVTNLSLHEKSKRHQNAKAYDDYQHGRSHRY